MGAMRLLLLCLLLASVSAVRRLNKTDDLNNVDYGRPAPRHGLRVLFWFSQRVRYIDQNGILTLDSNFDITRGDFGFRYFGNKDSILPSLKQGRTYYSVGNLKSPGANALPDYVQVYRNIRVPETNMDRLMVSVDPNYPNRVYNVFITAHNRGRKGFNSAATYEIDSALIQEIRSHRVCTLNNYQGEEEAKDCCRFLKQIKYDRNNTFCLRMSGLQKNCSVKAGLQTNHSKPTFCNEPGADNANTVIPTRIKGCDASLQLYTEDGKACARLYIKKTFRTWKDVFKNSLVGFYTDKYKGNGKYSTYQQAVKFKKVKSTNDYYILKYQSNLPIARGVQIRFLMDKNYDNAFARTTPWEDAEEVMISPSDCDNLKPDQSKVPSYWPTPEIFYRPEFDDANRILPTKLMWYSASLQLYTKDGKACARLYIKNTFKNWKDVLKNSWVGFYTGAFNANDKFSTFQDAVNFEKVRGESTEDFDVYKYQSDLPIAPGIQIRFLLNKNYKNVLAQTFPWDGLYVASPP